MSETLFEYVFKLTPIQNQDGRLIFQTGNLLLFGGILLLVVLALLAIYRYSNRYNSRRVKYISIGLRTAALILLCLPFFEPAMMVPDVIPRENFVAILVDNSASMGIKDGHWGESRYQDTQTILTNPDNGLLPVLEDKYKVRFYAFNKEVTRTDSLGQLDPQGRKTNMTAAFQRISTDFKGLPLSGIVLFTDGADNSLIDPKTAAGQLRQQSIPLHIVGLGAETLETDRELLEVKTNKALQEGTGTEIEIKTRSWGEETEAVAIDILDNETLVYTKPVQLKGNGKIDYFSFSFEPNEKGTKEYSVQLTPAEQEKNLENNSLDMLLDTQDDTIKVLHFQGHLNTEFKFTKRALENDPVIAITTVSRTFEEKLYRQGIQNNTELQSGFPASEEALYKYKVILLGDIEAAYFSAKQLEMLEKFVRKRGGGFLMAGGKGAFTEGAYRNTPVADVLPVMLQAGNQISLPDFNDPRIPKGERGFQFQPTREGLENPVLKLSGDLNQNKLLWDEMPNLFSINNLGIVKPGGLVLAEKPEDRFGKSQPLLVVQRYGSGRSAALATMSTWRWRMLRETKDTHHERFWRQLIHWLAESAYDPVNIDLDKDRIEPGDEVLIQLSIFDPLYNPLANAEISAIATGPSGETVPLNFLPDLTEEGEYLATLTTTETGVYTITVEAKSNDIFVGKKTERFLCSYSNEEFYNATLRKNLLENLASLAGGQYYHPAQAGQISKNITVSKSNRTFLKSEYLWDLPLLFFLIVILLSAEWVFRRQRGLP